MQDSQQVNVTSDSVTAESRGAARMDPVIKAKWVAALRSGEYKQGQHSIRDKNNRFCCLGVLCNLHAKAHPKIAATQISPHRYDGSGIWASDRVQRWAGIDDTTVVEIGGLTACLAAHNDDGRTFAEIADAIEAQL